MRFSNRVVLSVIIIVVVMAAIGGLMKWGEQNQMAQIGSFEECARAGYPVMESYPEQCRTADGRSFARQVSDAHPITIIGELVCLPHKDTQGPQTMECAYGFKDEEGKYYSVWFASSEYKVLMSPSSMGRKIEARGMFTQKSDKIYQSVGVIEIQGVRAL